MSEIESRLSQLEAHLRKWIEGSSARLFSQKRLQKELAERLSEEMQAGIRVQSNGERIAPNLYLVEADSSLCAQLAEDPSLLEGLAQALENAGQEAGVGFHCPPVVRLVESTQALAGQIQVVGRISIENLAETTELVSARPEPGENSIRQGFLVVDGVRIFVLDQPVINIGRRKDNDLVLDDGRVSRVHAQLRDVHGYYMIFDLDSTGGTFVNDQRIQQSMLYPGDVISLGGIPIVYGEDDHLGQTQQLSNP